MASRELWWLHDCENWSESPNQHWVVCCTRAPCSPQQTGLSGLLQVFLSLGKKWVTAALRAKQNLEVYYNQETHGWRRNVKGTSGLSQRDPPAAVNNDHLILCVEFFYDSCHITNHPGISLVTKYLSRLARIQIFLAWRLSGTWMGQKSSAGCCHFTAPCTNKCKWVITAQECRWNSWFITTHSNPTSVAQGWNFMLKDWITDEQCENSVLA